MSRSHAAAWATIAAIAGAVALAYIITRVSPYAGAGQWNIAGLLGLFGATLLLVSGLVAVAALALHERWPTLAGVNRRHPAVQPPPEAALRQGILVATAVCALLTLRLFGLLDPEFILVALLMTGLIEAFWQNRPLTRRL